MIKNIDNIANSLKLADDASRTAGRTLEAATKAGADAATIRNLTKQLDNANQLRASKQLEVNSLTKSDFIKSTDSPAVAVEKNTFLNNATDWIKNNPGYTILGVSAVGLAAYCFTTGSSLSEAASALAGSAGNAAGSAVGAAFSGIMSAVNSFISSATGIPIEYVKYIWYVIGAILIYLILRRIKNFFSDLFTNEY